MDRSKPHPTTFEMYLLLNSKGCYDADTLAELDKLGRPDKMCGWRVPKDLNDLTMGELADLIMAKDDLMTIIRVVCKAKHPEKVMQERAGIVIGFCNWITKEFERIGRMFDETSVPPTPQEAKAGIDRLKFGLFGTIDWYASRQGYHDQDEVLKVKWVRIWQCAKQDAEKAMFERRLNKVYQDEQRQASRH